MSVKGWVGEQFAYLSNLVLHLKRSDIRELDNIARSREIDERKGRNYFCDVA